MLVLLGSFSYMSYINFSWGISLVHPVLVLVGSLSYMPSAG